MDTTCTRIDQFWQCLDIGTQKFSFAAIIKNLFHDRMLGTKAFQHLFVGHILTRLGFLGLVVEVQFLKEQDTHLTGGLDIELFASQCIDIFLYLLHLTSMLFAHLLQSFCVQAYPSPFHLCQHRHQWHLNIAEQLPRAFCFEHWTEHILQTQRDIGIFGSIRTNKFRRHFAH